MRKSLQITFIAACLFLWAAKAPSASSIPHEWEFFRSKFPHHIQGVALSETRTDGTRVLIVAEPPPHVTLASLRDLSPVLANLQTATQRLGHDGWVKDVVVTLPRSDNRALSSLCQKINRHLFGTSYKAYVLEIPGKIITPPTLIPQARYQLDYKISAAELQKWILTDHELFQPVEGGEPRVLLDVMAEKRDGVFVSETKGLVVWVIPDDADLRDYVIEAREFALDSDLIVGAVAAGHCKAVFGRERTMPVEEVPPLRAETLMLLAAANTNQLAQSYERTNAFAGRFDETRDWAPIFLSPQLIDTEYGSLLNVTDQLLKSWSNCGVTEYENFRYSKPDHWPFRTPIINELGVNEIVYNWNTKGAGYAIESEKYALLALNRTGALPVSYIPSGGAGPEAIEKAEDAAYEFFAGMGDSNLARVVQYAAFYQIFTNFGIKASGDVSGPSDRDSVPLLEEEANRLLTALKNADEQQLTAFAAGVARTVPDSKLREEIEHDRAFIEKKLGRRLTRKDYPKLVEFFRKKLIAIEVETLADLRSQLRRKDAESFRSFIHAMMNRNSQPEFVEFCQFLQSTADLIALREALVQSHPATPGTWIHTPAVVVSFNRALLAKMVGGHNLDAEISVFRTSKDVRAGEIKMGTSREGVPLLLCNESDVSKVNALVRKAGRNSEDMAKVFPEIQAEFKRIPAAPLRSQKKALGFESDHSLPSERGLQPAYMPKKIAGIENGWQPRRVSTADVQRLRPYAMESTSATIEYQLFPDGRHQVSYILPGDATGGLVTSTNEAGEVADIVGVYLHKHAATSQPPTIIFRGTTADEAYSMTKQLEFGQEKLKTQPLRICAGEKMDPAAVMKAVHADYDFSKATIEGVGNKMVGGRNELSFELRIPALEPTRPTLRMRFKIFFEKILGKDVVAEIQMGIAKILKSFTGQNRLLNLYLELHKELDPLLRTHGAEGDFLFQIDTEKGDLIITLHPWHGREIRDVALRDRAG
jgi:hypothetical protein